jgi:hypothetical protein
MHAREIRAEMRDGVCVVPAASPMHRMGYAANQSDWALFHARQ